MPTYALSCLICGSHDDTDLVAIQAHAMREHGVTADQLRLADRRGPITLEDGAELYEWRLPVSEPWAKRRWQTWLRAVRQPEGEC